MTSPVDDDRPWHGTSRKRQAPLYDETVPTPTHAERARTLAVSRTVGTLSTHSAEMPGYPHGSMVTLAWDEESPIFLISRLAEHTKNLEKDPRCSLMLSEQDGSNPLALGRLTALGTCRRLEPTDSRYEAAKRAYLSTHPDAKYYIDYADFDLWQLCTERVRYIGGFGRMSWFDGQQWQKAQPDPLNAHANGIIAHMNDDHVDAMVAYCRAFTQATEAERVKMTGVDRYGFEMSVETPEGWRPIRLAFSETVSTPKEVRVALVELVAKARAALEG